MTATLTPRRVHTPESPPTIGRRDRYAGVVRILGPDGVLWDVASGELAASGSPVAPTVGALLLAPDAALAHWAGPVLLELPGGRLQAILTPHGRRGDRALVQVTGLDPLP